MNRTEELFPALTGGVVTERHARTCEEQGHATYVIDGSDQGMCPRCGHVVDASGLLHLSNTYRVEQNDAGVEITNLETGNTRWLQGHEASTLRTKLAVSRNIDATLGWYV